MWGAGVPAPTLRSPRRCLLGGRLGGAPVPHQSHREPLTTQTVWLQDWENPSCNQLVLPEQHHPTELFQKETFYAALPDTVATCC